MTTPTISCGPRNDHGARLVVATLGALTHRDTFDTNGEFRRGKFIDKVVAKFKLPAKVRETIESLLLSAADIADADPGAAEAPLVTTVADIEPKTTEWLWQGKIPAGALVVFDGDPGLGKSTLTCDLAARVSRGDAMPPAVAPDGTCTPRGVLILSAEDDAARTIRQRLDAAGADNRRVHLLKEVRSIDDSDRLLTLPGDVPLIEKVVLDNDVALVVIDPWSAFLDGRVSTNNDADVRRALAPLAAMAERTQAAIVLIRHLNKKAGSSAIYRGGGSIAIVGAARASFLIGVGDDDPDIRVFANVKNNLAPLAKSLAFEIESAGATSRVKWIGDSELSADDLLGSGEKPLNGSKTEEAKKVIEAVLVGGPRGEREVWGACEERQISRSTYWRARKQLGIVSEKVSFGSTGEWLLSLPHDHPSGGDHAAPF